MFRESAQQGGARLPLPAVLRSEHLILTGVGAVNAITPGRALEQPTDALRRGAADALNTARDLLRELADGNPNGLDYFGARYLSGAQGRFTSPDPLMASATIFDPQSWNSYTYALNNPLRFIDPDGLKEMSAGECARTQGCVTVKLNVIYDSNADLSDKQKAQFKKGILQNAKDEYGDRNVHFEVAETTGTVQMKGGKIAGIEGIQSGAVNVILTDTNVIRSAGASGESNGIAVALINTYRADGGTLSHELGHLFLGTRT